MNSNTPNRLLFSQSPYLLQHAYNPVDWMEWNADAWEMSKQSNKLVIVSIGYSTCHWCHVMAHECFEDFEIADLMNHRFINIKVDREERPDVDSIYMDACQIMTGRGGWPLNVICLPNQRPIYAGTYFPKSSWIQVLEQISIVWEETPEQAYEYGNRMMEHLQTLNQQKSVGIHSEGETRLQRNETINISGAVPTWKQKSFGFHALEGLLQTLDFSEGGVDRTPKFPLPGLFEFVLDTLCLQENPTARDSLHLTLIKMRNGGIYDAVRGGFCRYSTDGFWFAPHFEKMLYDNGQLLSLYARSYGFSDAPLYSETATHIVEFVNREMLIPLKHGFLIGSALDADSEGEEGKFYTFTYQELEQHLSTAELQLAEVLYGISTHGNWEHQRNIIHQRIAPLQALESLNISAGEYHLLQEGMLNSMFNIQESRIRPSFDYKIIVSWNALYLKGLTQAAIYLQRKDLVVDAELLGQSLWTTFWNEKTHTLCRSAAGKDIHQPEFNSPCDVSISQIPGFLEDYAFLCDAFLNLYEITADYAWIERSLELCHAALSEFSENDQMPVFNPKSGEALIIHKVDSTDDVIPSAVSVFCHCLQQLQLITGNHRFRYLSEQWVGQMEMSMKQQSGWHFQWLRVAQNIAWGGLLFKYCHKEKPSIELRLELALQAHQRFPSWSFLSWEFSSEQHEKSIQVCTANQCFPGVPSMEMALEIAKDYTNV